MWLEVEVEVPVCIGGRGGGAIEENRASRLPTESHAHLLAVFRYAVHIYCVERKTGFHVHIFNAPPPPLARTTALSEQHEVLLPQLLEPCDWAVPYGRRRHLSSVRDWPSWRCGLQCKAETAEEGDQGDQRHTRIMPRLPRGWKWDQQLATDILRWVPDLQ